MSSSYSYVLVGLINGDPYYLGNLYDLLRTTPDYNTGDWWCEMRYALEEICAKCCITKLICNSGRIWEKTPTGWVCTNLFWPEKL